MRSIDVATENGALIEAVYRRTGSIDETVQELLSESMFLAGKGA
jgi:hypothetical protein